MSEERADRSARDRGAGSHITTAFREGMPRPVLSSDLFRARSQTSFHALLRTCVPTTGGLIIGTFLRLHSADKAAKKVSHTQAHKGPSNQYRHRPTHPAGPAQRALTGGMRRKSRVSESYDRGVLAPARARSPSGVNFSPPPPQRQSRCAPRLPASPDIRLPRNLQRGRGRELR